MFDKNIFGVIYTRMSTYLQFEQLDNLKCKPQVPATSNFLDLTVFDLHFTDQSY